MPGVRTSLQAQPAVKSILVYRNGEAGRGPRRVVVHEKRVSSLESLLRELSGGTRRLHTPQGHRVGALEDIQHRGTYVAAGQESFRKIDYLQIGNRNKQAYQNNGNGLVKPVPQNRIVVSARFLKPIKEPCTIFVVANGDVLNPAVRFLVPNRLLGQFERILEMITEKIGLRILGGVRSLYTFEGTPVSDGKELENGQFYVAVGRDKFKRLPYSDLLFTKPMGMRRVVRSKAASLPPIYGFRRQNGDLGNHLTKSTAGFGDSGEAKNSPLSQRPREPVATLVREISQARLVTLRKKRSGLTVSLSTQENDDGEQKTEGEDEECGDKQSAEEPSPEEPLAEEPLEEEPLAEEPLEEEPLAEEPSELEPSAEVPSSAKQEKPEDVEEDPGTDETPQTAEEESATREREEEEAEEEEKTEGDGEGGETAENEENTTAPEEEAGGEKEEVQADEGAANEEGGAEAEG